MKNLIFTLSFVSLFIANLILPNALAATKPKNIILMIGDGMGPQQISLLYYFAHHSKLNIIGPKDFSFKRLVDEENGFVGVSHVGSHDKIVVDSACSATQLAIGSPSQSEMVGVDYKGAKVQTILEKARARGLGTGLVSDTRLTHATPSAFASHAINRWSEDQIATDMIKNKIDVLYSGGAAHFIPANQQQILAEHLSVKSKRKDNLDLVALAKNNGAQIVTNVQQLKNLDQSKSVLGLFTEYNMPNGVWYSQNKNDPARTIPNLKEMTESAVKYLSKKEKGYFLMVEGGQIDWMGHHNDVGGTLHEMLAFNDALNWLVDWVKKNPDTLLIVTADHETGSFGFSYNAVNIPKPQKLTKKGETSIFAPNFNYGSFDILDKLYKQKLTLDEMFIKYDKEQKGSKQANPKLLTKIVNSHSEFKITEKHAAETLVRTPNKFYNPDYKAVSDPEVNHMQYYQSFYFGNKDQRSALLAKMMADETHAVWGSGHHTSTPVLVFSLGPKAEAERFGGYLTHVEIGKMMQEILGL